MPDAFTFNDREFADSLRLYQEATGKDAADIVNKKAKDVCFKAAKHTKRAKLRDYTKHNPAVKRWKDSGPGGKRYPNRLLHATATKGNKFGKSPRGKGNQANADKQFAARKSAMGYSKAIWMNIAKDFGATLRGKFNIKTAKGTKARPNDPVAIIEAVKLDSKHLSETLLPPFKKALKEVERDTREYAERKLADTAAKYSAA